MTVKGTSNPHFLDAALGYAEMGWSIIPIRHQPRAKMPVVAWKQFQAIRPTEAQLRRMFNRGDLDGLAVILGAVSGGLWCRDFDDVNAYWAWARAYPAIAARIPKAQTVRGFHVYGRWPSVESKEFADGEMRSDGQYVIVPPSRHPSGSIYTWVTPIPPDGPPPSRSRVLGAHAPVAGTARRAASRDSHRHRGHRDTDNTGIHRYPAINGRVLWVFCVY